MRASINLQTITIIGKTTELDRIMKTFELMSSEIDSVCLMEVTSGEQIELVACYSSDECTVATVKESYSESKKLASK